MKRKAKTVSDYVRCYMCHKVISIYKKIGMYNVIEWNDETASLQGCAKTAPSTNGKLTNCMEDTTKQRAPPDHGQRSLRPNRHCPHGAASKPSPGATEHPQPRRGQSADRTTTTPDRSGTGKPQEELEDRLDAIEEALKK